MIQPQYWKTSRTKERASQKSKKKDLGKKEETGDFLSLACMKWK
jgi:hypothetical protein